MIFVFVKWRGLIRHMYVWEHSFRLVSSWCSHLIRTSQLSEGSAFEWMNDYHNDIFCAIVLEQTSKQQQHFFFYIVCAQSSSAISTYIVLVIVASLSFHSSRSYPSIIEHIKEATSNQYYTRNAHCNHRHHHCRRHPFWYLCCFCFRRHHSCLSYLNFNFHESVFVALVDQLTTTAAAAGHLHSTPGFIVVWLEWWDGINEMRTTKRTQMACRQLCTSSI